MMATWDWIAYQGFIIQSHSLSLSSQWLPVALLLLLGVELAKFLPSMLVYQTVLSPCRFCLGNHAVVIDFMGMPFLSCPEDTLEAHPGSWLLESFHRTLLRCPLSLPHSGCVDVPVGDRHCEVACSSYSDLLWISVIVPISFKKIFSNEGCGTYSPSPCSYFSKESFWFRQASVLAACPRCLDEGLVIKGWWWLHPCR